MNAPAPLQWTETPPTVPGWYWKRKGGNGGECRMVEHLSGYAPKSGPQAKRALFETLEELGTDPEAVAVMHALPASHWLIEWAGPLVPPA